MRTIRKIPFNAPSDLHGQLGALQLELRVDMRHANEGLTSSAGAGRVALIFRSVMLLKKVTSSAINPQKECKGLSFSDLLRNQTGLELKTAASL